MMATPPELTLLTSPDWGDYALLDSGGGQKLERYGPYTFVRPEPQAIWEPALPRKQWQAAHAVFQPGGGESGGAWAFHKPVQPSWEMRYKELAFQAHASDSRHMGVFPEQANHWDWIAARIQERQDRQPEGPIRVLNLFGYTGLATLAASQAGAHITHVDASRHAINQARHNQSLSRLEDRPIRWLVDDVPQFVQREVRRGSRYEGLILDPPKFGRGAKGRVWEFSKSLPALLQDCRKILSEQPLFVVLTAYAVPVSALSIYYLLEATLDGLPAGPGGVFSTGELALVESSAGRHISTAIFTRWQANNL